MFNSFILGISFRFYTKIYLLFYSFSKDNAKKINMIGMKSKLINPSPRNLRKRIKTISPTTSLISIMAPRLNRLMVHQLRLMTLQAKYLTITLKKQKKISWLVRQPCQVSKTKSLKSTMLKASRQNRSKVLQLLWWLQKNHRLRYLLHRHFLAANSLKGRDPPDHARSTLTVAFSRVIKRLSKSRP